MITSLQQLFSNGQAITTSAPSNHVFDLGTPAAIEPRSGQDLG